jgi:hypothetical protein
METIIVHSSSEGNTPVTSAEAVASFSGALPPPDLSTIEDLPPPPGYETDSCDEVTPPLLSILPLHSRRPIWAGSGFLGLAVGLWLGELNSSSVPGDLKFGSLALSFVAICYEVYGARGKQTDSN